MSGITVRPQQIIVSPDTAPEVHYVVEVDNPTFSGAIGAGKTTLSSPALSKLASSLIEHVTREIAIDLGFEHPQEKETPLFGDDDEELL